MSWYWWALAYISVGALLAGLTIPKKHEDDALIWALFWPLWIPFAVCFTVGRMIRDLLS